MRRGITCNTREEKLLRDNYSRKDKPHLNKHISHLFRLYIMGTEILEGKGTNLPEGPNMSRVNDLVMEINRSVLKNDQ